MVRRLRYFRFLAAAFAVVVAVPAGAALNQNADQKDIDHLAVVELFTSQGCNSCPPADAYAAELAKRPDVLVLSWNVDYWDYLGWKDTLASPQNTARQRAYNRALGRGSRVYTPQMIISGRDYAVGSNRRDVESALSEDGNYAVVADVVYGPETVTIKLPAVDGVAGASVSIVHFEFARTIPIGSGENGGRSITYTHSVVKSDTVATWNGEATEIVIDREKFCDKGNAVLVQMGTGPIIAAAVVDTAHN